MYLKIGIQWYSSVMSIEKDITILFLKKPKRIEHVSKPILNTYYGCNLWQFKGSSSLIQRKKIVLSNDIVVQGQRLFNGQYLSS